MSESTALAVNLIDFVNLDEVQATMKKINTFQAIVKTNLKQGHDYGVIPGTPKPTLYKPGGEKVCMMFGINPEYELFASTEDYKGEFFSYNFKCTLLRGGFPCAQGVGSCNSKEKKYRYVNVSELPAGYVGYSEQTTTSWGEIKYKIDNNDICSLANTIMKMAKKRAFIDAVLQVASLSEVFTQDIEDLQDFAAKEQEAAAGSVTPEQAGRIKITFGKFKGKTLSEIYREDNSYIVWLADNAKQANVKTACAIMLEAVKEAKSKKSTEKTTDAEDQRGNQLESGFIADDANDVDFSGTPFENDPDDEELPLD